VLGIESPLCQTPRVAPVKFGTDGWRAVIAEDFNFANVARVAQAAADYWQSELRTADSAVSGRQRKIVVGYDRRFFSDRFAQISAEVLAANNFEVLLTPEPTPTPAVSYAVKQTSECCGRGHDYGQPQSADF